MTIVIHPGSRWLKIGRAKAAFPKFIPHCIAHRLTGESVPSASQYSMFTWPLPPSDFPPEDLIEERMERLQSELAGSRRHPPNLQANIRAFNEQQGRPGLAQSIPLHNDPYGLEWTETDAKFVVGSDALRLDPGRDAFALRWPLVEGRFNQRDYQSTQAVLDDLERIWGAAVRAEIGPGSRITSYNVVLVLDETLSRWEVSALAGDLCLREMGFRAVAVLRTGQAATFGAGISSGLVVDMGAQKTSIACVEDGVLLPRSMVSVPIGGEDLMVLFWRLLGQSAGFSLDLDLGLPLDYELVERELLFKLLSGEDQDRMAVLTFEFFRRHPGRDTAVHSVKLCDERILPLVELLYPGMPLLRECSRHRHTVAGDQRLFPEQLLDRSSALEGKDDPKKTASAGFGERADSVVSLPDTDNVSTDAEVLSEALTDDRDDLSLGGDPSHGHLAQTMAMAMAMAPSSEQVQLNLVDYIHKSLLALESPEKRAKLLANALFIGGAHQFPGLKECLLRPYLPEGTEFVPDLDPRQVAWKGGAVLAKLDGVAECWIEGRSWAVRGDRLLSERLPFAV